MSSSDPSTMKALWVQRYGAPADVLHLADVPVPSPRAGQVRVRVHACAFNPADWAVCQGFFPLPPPRGIGFDVAGTVDAIGEGVTDVNLGDPVFGVPDYLGYPTAGAAEFAVLKVWFAVPHGLSLEHAACLPMAVETATRSIDLLGLSKGQTIMINGGGTMTGFAAVQIALLRGAHVIASAGETFADRLRALGAKVTPYGEGMVERVREIAQGATDFALHTARVEGVLPDLIRIVGGDPRRVMSFSDFDEGGLGVRTTGREKEGVHRYDVLGDYARLAAVGQFAIPVARTFTWEDWREAVELSMAGRAHGKLLLIPGPR
ncbi:NADP-dependent oxidoreductase [Paraburkholderia kururiensis]|jgi:D-arabinose 1-dehydrogenase-like Zn-dependent alcohol dehydrogenase|uniref:NADP-dependent oxidoreductase n=1 Tax=Paraburkholderia kururiensis TaxID=984307 RepID=UPI000A2EF6BC|nr:NADP-dependent oxidoreductase [Paraburkholderia kururiensis]